MKNFKFSVNRNGGCGESTGKEANTPPCCFERASRWLDMLRSMLSLLVCSDEGRNRVRVEYVPCTSRLRVCKQIIPILIAFTLGVGQMWGAATTIASWGCASYSASTNYPSTGGDANNYSTKNDKAYFTTTKAFTTSATNAYYGSSSGGAVITFKDLNLSGYTGVTITFYSRASKGGNFQLAYSTNGGSTWTNGNTCSNLSTSGTPAQRSISFPADAASINAIKLTHSASSGSLYFGTVVISGTAGSSSVAVTGVSVSPTSKSIVPGETFAITPTVSPAGATNKAVTWTSSATSKATVSNGTVTGVAAGSSTITCTTTDGGFTATCAVTICGVTMQALDEEGHAIPAGGPGAPSRTGNSISPAADANNYVFKEWSISGASLGSSKTTKSNTITSPTGAVTVTAVYYKPIAITYKANGQDFTTQTYGYGGTLAFPANGPNGDTYSCTGKTFTGWVAEANKDYSHASTAPTYATAGGSVTTEATYYAVFAKESDGGSSTKWVKTQLSNIDEGTYALITTGGKAFNGTISSGHGQTTTDAFSFDSNNEATSAPTGTCELELQAVTGGFKIYNATHKYLYAKAASSGNLEWHNSESSYWSYSSSNWQYKSNSANLRVYNNTFRTYSNSSNDAVLFAKKVTVSNKTYSNFETNCCTPLGTISGVVSLTHDGCGAGELKATWKMSTVTGIASQVLHIYKASDNSEVTAKKITGLSASTENQTQTISGLDNCTAYYVKVENKSSGSSFCGDEIAGTSESATTLGYTYGISKTNVSLKAGADEEGSTCDGNFSAQYEAAAGYALPTTLTVSGASAHTWSVSEGVGTLSISAANVTGNVSTTIAGTCIEPVVTGPVDAEYYVGDAPTALSVSATLASGTLTYLWKVSTNNGETWSNAAGTNNEATYSGASLSTASDGTLKFKCIVGNSEGGCSVESAVATISVSIASYFQNNKTLFIEAGASGSAWDAEACVKAWFRDGNEGGEAVATQWLANSGDGKKIFATVIPSTGDYRYMTLQRFGDNCNGFYNDNGSVSKADDGGSNVVKTTCSSTECVSWSPSALSLYLRGDIDSWAGNLATLSDQNAGIWTATISNHVATATSREFRIADSYSNLHGNGNITLSGMIVGSTYNITASYDVTSGTLTMSKEFVKGEVSFDLQGHGSAISKLTNVTAGSKISAPSAPSATGYTFGGWYKESTCENAWDFDNDVVNETMTLYAKWTIQNYTISSTLSHVTAAPSIPTNYTYTGSAAGLSYTITADEGYRLPAEISVSGTSYTWSNGTLTLTGTITDNVSISIEAVQAYTITWSANGVETTSTVDAGNKLVLPEDDPATCNGTYGTFIGWYTIAAGTNSTPSNAVSGTKADANHTPSGDETYYAVWGNGALSGDFSLVTNVSQLHEGDVVTIASVKGNSQSGSVIKAYNSGNNWPKASVTTNASGNIPANTTDMRTFTLAEGTVDGTWAFYDGTGYIYAANTSNGTNNYMKRKTTLDAAGSFTISINGTSSAATVNSNGSVNGRSYIRWNSNNSIFSCYASGGQSDIYLYKQASAATGFISNCCNSLDAFNGAVSWSNPTTAVLKWDNIAHVSSWAVKYKKHADANYSDFAGSITGTENKTCTISSLVCGTDYDFQIIATPEDGYCDKSQTINDTQAHKYAITLDPANGEVTGGSFLAADKACDGDNVDLLAEAATGYAFSSWTITKASSGNVSPAANIAETTFEMPAEAVTVSAAFSLVNYTISYMNMEGATNHVSNPATYTINSPAITLGDPEKDGFDFGGWFTDGDLAPEHAVGTPAIAAGSHENKTFYAKWTQTGTHIVTIADYSNGTVSVTYTGMESTLTSGSRTIEENTVLTITATPNTGYEGLLTVNDVDFTSGSTHTLVADIAIEALFEPKSYTITYKDKDDEDYSGSNLASLPDSHTYNTATVLVNGVKAGYSFGGWFTDAACTESAGSSLGATAYTDNITLYAKWEEVTMYSVTWMVNGAAYSAGTPTTSVEAGDAISNLPTAPEVCDEDLTFMGWTNAAIEGTQVAAPAVLFTTAGAAPAVTGNVTFYAVFAKANELTATFNAADISNLTENSSVSWTHKSTGISFTISYGGYRYTTKTPYSFTVPNGNSNYGYIESPDGVTIKKVILTGTSADYLVASVTPGSLATSGTTQTISSVNDEYLYIYPTLDKQIRITNLDVYYTPASPTYSNYRTSFDISIPTPTLDVASGKYTSDQLIAIDNYDDNYMYFYTTDGSTPAADANLDPISPAVVYDSGEGIAITSDCTVKVVAYDLCHNASAVTTATYTIAESLTLAEFVEQKPTTNEKVDLTGAIVMARETNRLYVQKDAAAMCLYYSAGAPSFAVGKQIANGVITGHYDADDLEMVVTNAGSPTATADGVLPTPLVITDDNAETLLVEANMYRYAQMNSVTLDYDNSSYLNAYSANNSYYYDDWFEVLTSKTLPLSTTECSVKGIITPYSVDDVNYFDQLSPILVNDISTNATAILPTISDLGGADAAHAVEVAEGKEITITEDANFDAIYQINDGAETAINTSTVVTITNTAAATKVYVKASRDYYADNTITYYYIANSALTEHTITCATGLAGGSIGADKSAAVTGATVTLTPTPAEHYHLVSWTVTYNDGEEKTIDVVNNQFTMPGYNVNVTAAFAEDAFATVSFAKGDEAVTGDVPANQKVYVGDNVTMPANPFTYAGHNFAGWKYNETTKQAGETYAITAAGTITFTAQWTANPICTITLHANGADDIVTEVLQGATYNIPNAGTIVGYTFLGWATAAQNSEVTEAIDVVSSFTPEVQAVASTKEFYAVYTRQEGENQYVKVTSDLGTAWAADYLIAYSSTIFADGRKGGKDNAGEIGKADVKVDLSARIVENTIAAEYGNPYKVTLEEISANSNTYLLKTQDGKYNYYTSNGNGLSTSTNKNVADDYPITVTFTSENDVRLCLGGDATGAAFRYNTSNRLFRYYGNASQSAIYLYKYISGTTYYTTNPAVKYNVSYELGEGAWRANEGCDASVVEAGTVYNEVCEYEPVLANKVFDKWQVNDADIELPYTINANTAFTAVYRDAVQYAVNYDKNGGVGNAPAATNVLEDADYTVLANSWFFRSGYTFEGWNTAADGTGAAYAAEANMVMPSENVTLYAQWQVMPANEKEVVIVAKAGANYYAMGQTLTTKQFNAIAVAGVRDNKVILPDGFSDENKTAITWHMLTNDNGATASFYSPANSKYLAGGNDLSLSNDPVDWTWDNENQCYVISGRTFMYRSSYDFRSYSTSNFGTSGYAEAMYVTTEFAKAITTADATEAGLSLGDNVVVKDGATLTIGSQQFINDVVVENGGNLTLNANLSVHDLVIHSTLGKGTGTTAQGNAPGNCGQVANGGNITVNGDVYLELELTQDAAASAGWYAFSVPFKVDATNGVYYGNTKLQYGVGYAIMSYHGDLRAAGEYGWKKFHGIMEPGVFYVITVGNTDYKTLRFKKVAGENLVASTNVSVSAHPSDNSTDAAWNGIGNPNLQISNLSTSVPTMQFYDHKTNTFIGRDHSVNLVVGSAFFIQYNTTSSVYIPTTINDGHGYLLPQRERNAAEEAIYEVQLTNLATDELEDNIFLSAREEALNEYEIGHDVAKMSMGTAKCAQMWVPAYGTKLCAADFPLVNNKVTYPLTITAPQAGTYSISTEENDAATIYLTKDGHIIWNLSMSPCEIELPQGTTEGYGLVLRTNAPSTATGVENTEVSDQNSDVQKVIIDEHVYILRGGEIYDVTGKMVK